MCRIFVLLIICTHGCNDSSSLNNGHPQSVSSSTAPGFPLEPVPPFTSFFFQLPVSFFVALHSRYARLHMIIVKMVVVRLITGIQHWTSLNDRHDYIGEDPCIKMSIFIVSKQTNKRKNPLINQNNRPDIQGYTHKIGGQKVLIYLLGWVNWIVARLGLAILWPDRPNELMNRSRCCYWVMSARKR